jgi:hypothetical protein
MRQFDFHMEAELNGFSMNIKMQQISRGYGPRLNTNSDAQRIQLF